MVYRLAFLFVILTGFTGLVYQVTWHKYLSFYLGSHAMAAAQVLAVFFLFLSLGYSFLGRNIHRIPLRNKLFLYGIIEALIGFYAVLSPEIFHWLVALLPPGGQSPTSDFLLGFLFTTLYIGIPTFLMGTTIPVLTQALSRDFETAHGTHAAVYGLNTLGAVFGALLTGFVLIEIWGLPLTLLNTGILNIAIGLATWLMWKARPDDFAGVAPDHGPSSNTAAASGDAPLRAGWVALLYAVSFASGFYVFSLENLMIRLAGLFIGSSGYTFAMIVAAFILGIALGSLWVGRRKITGPRFFLWVQVALLLSSVLLYLLVPVLPEWFARIRVIFAPSYINIPLYWTAVFTVFAAILLVPVALMGMNLPLIFNYLRSRGLFLSQTVGRIYGINTLGSVLGSLVGGYLLFFVLDWSGVFRFNLALIALTLPFILLLSGIRRVVPLAASALAFIAVLLLPPWDDKAFLPSASLITRAASTATSLEPTLDELRRSAELLFVYHGPAAHIGVLEMDGEPQLHINGNPNTGRGDWELRAMNALYPLSFVKDPERVFVVGLGGGLSASIFAEHPSIERVLVSEIAIGAIKALPWFDVQNADFTTQPYYDKVEFVAADAIKVLRSSNERFDVIVSEPNHPWVAGVENLFSVEFLTEVRDRLSDDGVYCQWFPLFVTEPDTVLTILNTFRQVFPDVRAFSTGGGTLSILASRQPLEPDLAHIRGVIDQYRHRLEPRESVFVDPELVLATEVLNDWMLTQIVHEYPATHTFEFPVVASASFRAKFAGVGSSFRDSVVERLHSVAPEIELESRMLYEQLRPELEKDFFNRARRVLSARGDTAVVSLPRLWYQHTTWFGEQPDWPEAEDRAMLAYVSGLDDAFPAHLLESDEEIDPVALPGAEDTDSATPETTGISSVPAMASADNEDLALNAAMRLYAVYRELIRAQVPARLDRVVAAVPPECDDRRCAELQRAIVFTALQGNAQARALNELDLRDDESVSEIRELFRQLRQGVGFGGSG
jgi:spermidine synthase